ncbi:MAG: sensor histidine kinase [Allosphingosinicella sp.]
MNDSSQGWIGAGRIEARFARLSTGLKMLLALSLALLPLGLVAIAASLESARQKSEERRVETLTRLQIKAQRLNSDFARGIITIGTAYAAIRLAPGPGGGEICRETLHKLEQGPVAARYALYAPGARLLCASNGFAPALAAAPRARGGTRIQILPGGETLRLWLYDSGGALEGVIDYGRATLHTLTYIPGTSPRFDLSLRQGGRTMVLRSEYAGGPFIETVRGSEPVGGGQLRLDIRLGARPFSAADILTILLPVLMWIFAALIGALVVHRLLLEPLGKVQRAVAAYRPGDPNIGLPRVATPAREINELGEAFDKVVRTVSHHEAELEAAVERQTRLVREVHHRVKNNLQVVASLLNLHARGSPNEQVSAAYASIQRRVDALAVVHRNHYAELEENRGVSLKSLISELAANLRATAPPSAAGMAIRLDVDPYYATQDVAVSVAFLITEIVEFAMLCGASAVSVALNGDGEGAGTATLMIETESLRGDVQCDRAIAERFERIVVGLSRQLRSTLERDTEDGRYCLDIAVVARGDTR